MAVWLEKKNYYYIEVVFAFLGGIEPIEYELFIFCY